MKLEEEKITIDKISRTIFDCVARFAPERYASSENSPSNDWMNKRIKNALTKEHNLFQQWINDPNQEN